MTSLGDIITLLEAGDFEAATREFEGLASTDQLDAVGRVLYSVVLLRSNRMAEANEQIGRLSDNELASWAAGAVVSSRQEEGLADARLDPPPDRRPEIIACLRARDFDRACALARHHITTVPSENKGKARALLARCLELSGSYTEALSNYALAVDLSPPSNRLFLRAGRCALQCKRYQTANSYFAIAHHFGDNGPATLLRMATAEIGLSMWARAHNLLTSALVKAPDKLEVICRLAYVELQLDRAEEALARLNTLGTEIENWREAWLWRIEAQRRCGLQDQSFEEATRLCDRYPFYGPGRLLLGDLAMNRQDFTTAIDCFRRILSDESIRLRSGMSNADVERRLQLCLDSLKQAGDDSTLGTVLPEQATSRAIPAMFQPKTGFSHDAAKGTFGSALTQQFGVIQALLLREVRSRFSRNKLGYLWAIIEPALQVMVFYLIFSAIGSKGINGMPLILFLTTGVISFSFLQNAYANASDAVAANRPLLIYPRVKTFDVVLSRVILQFCTSIIVLVIFLIGVLLYGETYPIRNPLEILFCLVLLCLAGMGMGMAINALATMMRSLPMIFGQVMRILFFTSGIFFTLTDLPHDLQMYLQYNPFLHLVEIIRDNFSYARPPEWTDLTYATSCVLVLLLFGLVSHVALHRKILAS